MIQYNFQIFFDPLAIRPMHIAFIAYPLCPLENTFHLCYMLMNVLSITAHNWPLLNDIMNGIAIVVMSSLRDTS
jgi:hypothetical protein